MVRLAVRCSPGQAEIVLAELTVLAPGGVEQVEGPDYVEFAIYGAEGELPELGEIDAAIGGGRVEVSSSVVDDGWEDRWKAFHRPVTVESKSGHSRVWVGPPWSERPTGDAIVIDPGRAFGTGAHPTTRICLSFMLDLADRGRAFGSLLDVGTGSGALAIAAARLGFDPVLAVDSELAAVEASSANADLNSVRIRASRADLRNDALPSAGTVVANLTAPLLGLLATRFGAGNVPVNLVCSGLLPAEREKVERSFSGIGLSAVDHRDEGGWAGILFQS